MRRRILNYRVIHKILYQGKNNTTKADLPFKLGNYFCGEKGSQSSCFFPSKSLLVPDTRLIEDIWDLHEDPPEMRLCGYLQSPYSLCFFSERMEKHFSIHLWQLDRLGKMIYL